MILTSIPKVDEEKEMQSENEAVSPIDLAVALESACWDLHFLVT